MNSRTLIQYALAAAALGAGMAASAGDFAWTQEKVSPALNHAGREVAVRYAPAGNRGPGPGPGSVITAVYAARDFQGAQVQSKLCWNDTQRCVPLVGGGVRSQDFNGLDAGKPFYLVHTAQGRGPLAQPLFITGSVTVWYR
ncbi:flagellar protein FlhE [Parapusillimonas granuli]|uniref:Flagellar protein FlhE n=1 Tax=Parapusillimonas granuli TaxID=380911 RepID=A0A853G700_9BURK|nr:flagellar protein FlhE [Parapusillimonas granuli]MBB5213995.1 putative membrane protein [Parapusillimonas granuli]NYT50416.1 flagellar protein FlhE [Parapusillimonas granuli]